MIFIVVVIVVGIIMLLAFNNRASKPVNSRALNPVSCNLPLPRSTVKNEVSRESEWLTIDKIDFFGQYVVSETKQFTFGWCDSCQESHNGRTRNISGRFVLLEGNDIILNAQMPRPNNGHVANNGTFAVCDWMARGKLNGKFMVLDRSGLHKIAHLFRANLHNCGISSDGQFAVCQTCNADNQDGNKLSFFEVQSGKLLWQVEPASGWADTYRFDVEKKCLYMCHRDGGEFAYNFSGLFLDAAKWETAREAKGIAYRKEMTVRYREDAHRLLKDGDFERARQAFSMWVDFAKQGKIEVELERAKKEYSEFAKRDPLYQQICGTIMPKIAAGTETRQSELYKLFPQFQKADIFYALYFAAAHGKVSRVKKGNTYVFSIIPIQIIP